MRRVSLLFALAVCALVCFASCVLWAHSYWTTETVTWQPARPADPAEVKFRATSSGGRLVFVRYLNRLPNDVAAPLSATAGSLELRACPTDASLLEGFLSPKEMDGIRFLGFAFLHRDYKDYAGRRGQLESYLAVVIPYWSLVMLSAVPPVTRGIGRMRRRYWK